MSLAHLPTLMLVIGYAVFWLELYVFKIPYGRTSLLASVLFLGVGIIVVSRRKEAVAEFLKFVRQGYKNQSRGIQFFLAIGATLSAIIFFCAFYAALLPPHLRQEWDSLHYHMSLPRQHLILHSFGHIPWAADDLFPLPLEFAMAPYWFVTELPNKFPQFLFFCGLVAVSVNLVRRLTGNDFLRMVLVFLAVFGSHNIGIQMGTAMQDLLIAYLFLAAIESFVTGAIFLGTIELVFFFWSKSFIPLQMGVILASGSLLIFLLRRFQGGQWTLFFREDQRVIDGANTRRFLAKAGVYFCLLSLAVGLPFVLKSIGYTGTPLYPFYPGLLSVFDRPSNWQDIVQASHIWVTQVKDQYGYGYSFPAFLKHLWLIAVPEEGVNNTYDYPIGLVYLLFAGPFLYRTVQLARGKNFSLISLFVILFWATWWMGSHQTRFLYIPIMLMVISVLADPKIGTKSAVLMAAFLVALTSNAMSVIRAHKQDFGVSFHQVLRPEDKAVAQLSQEYIRAGRNDIVAMKPRDVLYAQFPVRVTEQKLPHTLGSHSPQDSY